MRNLLLLLILAGVCRLSAQSNQLAQQYFMDGEYEKSAELYLALAEENYNPFYFDRYVSSLMNLQRYDEAEDALKKQIKRMPDELALRVKYGQLLEQKFDAPAAEKQYREAIKSLKGDHIQITQLANAFIVLTKYEYAIETYERGDKLLKGNVSFAFNLGDLYRRKGDVEPMISNYLDALVEDPRRGRNVQTYFQRYLDSEGLEEAQKQLYARIQEDRKDNPVYPEMLGWILIQRKDYKGALRQARALDRKLSENGERVFDIGTLASNASDYETAIAAFDYIVENKAPASPYYLEAKREGLLTRRRAITNGYAYTEDDLRILETAYLEFLGQFGNNPASARIAIQLAELEALYLNDLPKATEILLRIVELNGVEENVRARAKIALADYYLMQGEVWESTLLYSQVDKQFKEDLLGHEARFRNARLSYFRGDFEWAQSQFDVLKASTSRLIANDALDLSVFIMDNLGLDTSAVALQTYADAELLTFQNRFDEAFATLDKLVDDFPGHDLEDDVVYLRGRLYHKLRKYDEAAGQYQKVIDNYPKSIRLDNALFALAGLYENQLDDKAKAQQLYETLFIDYSNSILAVEARKKYRELRGDPVQ
ncbi:tetratricopeptide (TPR) repeat protein [Lewinella aquimaris]|uniref:Tetratricopeptide (TPR) repeat protein n=1 Tax=Neolewinella aquimaris TaxID=1835722 RepID=A0A840E196_9BACT|nr:tetratricopeptide repeat protein [Neolewinella aquimaris]MBB4078981.1 tetratricopeptide (TPR) repeat protein [Neolewinella aquimaris]